MIYFHNLPSGVSCEHNGTCASLFLHLKNEGSSQTLCGRLDRGNIAPAEAVIIMVTQRIAWSHNKMSQTHVHLQNKWSNHLIRTEKMESVSTGECSPVFSVSNSIWISRHHLFVSNLVIYRQKHTANSDWNRMNKGPWNKLPMSHPLVAPRIAQQSSSRVATLAPPPRTRRR